MIFVCTIFSKVPILAIVLKHSNLECYVTFIGLNQSAIMMERNYTYGTKIVKHKIKKLQLLDVYMTLKTCLGLMWSYCRLDNEQDRVGHP